MQLLWLTHLFRPVMAARPKLLYKVQGEIQSGTWGAEDGLESLLFMWPDIHIPVNR